MESKALAGILTFLKGSWVWHLWEEGLKMFTVKFLECNIFQTLSSSWILFLLKNFFKDAIFFKIQFRKFGRIFKQHWESVGSFYHNLVVNTNLFNCVIQRKHAIGIILGCTLSAQVQEKADATRRSGNWQESGYKEISWGVKREAKTGKNDSDKVESWREWQSW